MKPFSQPVIPPLVPVVLAMMAGILAGSASFLSNPAGMILFLVLLTAGSLFGVPGKKWIISGLCLAAGLWSGYQSHQLHHPRLTQGHISQFYNTPGLTMTGKIVSFSRIYPYKTRLVVACQKILMTDGNKSEQAISTNGRLFLNVYGKPDLPFGFYDRVRFSGKIRPIRNFGNPGAFDYQLFLKRQGIFGTVHTRADGIRKVSDIPQAHVIQWIQDIENTRNRFHHFVTTRLDRQDGAQIVAALVTGIKYRLSADIRNQFSKAGASHLLAISGLHLSILCLIFFFAFYRILSVFPYLLISARARKIAGILTLVPLGLYAVFSGFSPSTQRALIMAGIFMSAFFAERQSHPVNTLAGAGCLILLADPGALFSISFQLSFAAVLSIILGMGTAEKYKEITIPIIPRFLVSICVVTLLAGLGTFPLIVRYFNMVSLVQIPANLVLVPVIGFVCLPLGLVSLAVWPLAPGLAGGILSLAAGLVSLCIKYIVWLTDMPFAWAYLPALSNTEMGIIYLAMAAIFLSLYVKRMKWVAGMVVVMGLLASLDQIQKIRHQQIPPTHMTITVLDVGQGNAALIQTIEGNTILVDGGGFPGESSFDVGRFVVAPFLWHQGITALDMVIMTHPDSDHMNGLVFILENFTVGSLVKNMDTVDDQSFVRIMAACHQKRIPVVVPDCENSRWIRGRTRLEFFQCESVLSDLTPNDNSVVFKLILDRFAMLFPGDITAKREQLLTGHHDKVLSSKLLLAPHHGSNTSSTQGFLDRIHPEAVIISCGFNNPYRFPYLDVLNRYHLRDIRVFRTDIHGAITITSSGSGYNIATYYSVP